MGLCRDYKADAKQWGWSRAPPVSQKQGGEPDTPKKLRKKVHRAVSLFVLQAMSIADKPFG